MKVIAILLALSLVAVAFSKDQTHCQRRREQELNNKKLKGSNLIPECDENGDYKPLQCFPVNKQGKQFCQCWAKDGEIVKGPSTKIKSCECHVENHQKTKIAAPGTFIPTCEEDGIFSKKQCHGSTGQCWCADPKGKVLGEKKRGPIECK